MSLVAIIAEFNPFHNGHKYLIDQAKKNTGAEFVMAIMSGNFVQRGEPAFYDKFFRTAMALNNGVDIVVELPVSFASASAEFFAGAAVRVAANSEIVDFLAFGSENGNLDLLRSAALQIQEESSEFKNSLAEQLKQGNSFSKSKAIAASHGLSLQSNDILAIEYIKTLKLLNSKIIPIAVKRINNAYNDKNITGTISSATSIRAALLENKLEEAMQAIPCNCLEIIKATNNKFGSFCSFDAYSDMLRYEIAKLNNSELNNISGIIEGIENRIIRFSDFNNISDLVCKIKTKRYTTPQIQRMLLNILLGVNKIDPDQIFDKLKYIRVLGFRKDNEHLLKLLSEKSSLPIVINLKHSLKTLNTEALKELEFDLKTSDIYYSSQKNKQKKGYESSQPLVII